MKTTGRLVMTTALLVVLLLSLIPGCTQTPTQPQPTAPPTDAPPSSTVGSTPALVNPPQNQNQPFTVSSAPSSPIKVNLFITGSPELGQPFKVTATFGLRERQTFDAKNVTAQIILPDGLELVSGQPKWQGDVLRGNKYEISASVKAVKTGDWQIEARVRYEPGDGSFSGGTAYLYALVYADHASISEYASQPTEVPRAKPAPPPSERGFTIPPEEPGTIKPQPGRIPPPATRPPQTPSPSSSLPSRGVRTVNPLVITGGFYCTISDNTLPSPGTPWLDTYAPMVWGGFSVLNASTYQEMGRGVTNIGGDFSIEVENPWPQASSLTPRKEFH